MKAQPTARQPVLNQVLLVAADVNNGALLPSSNTSPDTGQGAPIATLPQQ